MQAGKQVGKQVDASSSGTLTGIHKYLVKNSGDRKWDVIENGDGLSVYFLTLVLKHWKFNLTVKRLSVNRRRGKY